jgi:hypothetical protein
MNDMRKLMEAIAQIEEQRDPKEWAQIILDKFVEDEFTVNYIRQEGFEECLSLAFGGELGDEGYSGEPTGYYALEESDQKKIERWVKSQLRKGAKIDPDVADSRGHIGGSRRG